MSALRVDRTRQFVTVGIGALLTIVMGAVLLIGTRVASQVTRNVTALDTASTLQTYPAELARQLSSLRDRLETRAYEGQALSEVKSHDAFSRTMTFGDR